MLFIVWGLVYSVWSDTCRIFVCTSYRDQVSGIHIQKLSILLEVCVCGGRSRGGLKTIRNNNPCFVFFCIVFVRVPHIEIGRTGCPVAGGRGLEIALWCGTRGRWASELCSCSFEGRGPQHPNSTSCQGEPVLML